ncbi:MAG TPA: NAD+ synthase [Bacteroidales bacterium]|nr:NAD+ synthase [Bacteroidales bacterium]HQO84942.1 NAD+ synthase [Bacteroidales bacterium]
MKVALAQLSYIPGDIAYNSGKILTAIEEARRQGADLVVFSELAVTGYPPLDLLRRSDIIDSSMAAIREIATHCNEIAAIVGGPSPNTGDYGKELHNSAFFLHEGKIKAVVNKTLLPNYDIFDEERYFKAGDTFRPVELNGQKIAVTICEDIWYEQPFGDKGPRRLYSMAPLDEIMKEHPSFIINIAANPFAHNRISVREEVFIRNTRKYMVPLISVNQTGGYSELIFDGSSVLIDSDGTIIDRLGFCTEEVRTVEIPSPGTDRNSLSFPAPLPGDMTGLIHQALVTGLRDFFVKGGIKRAIIGLSGGIDSAVVTALAAEALGPENTLALLMPSVYSSEHSVSDSVKMADKIGMPYHIVSIEDARQTVEKTLQPFFAGKEPGVTLENIQARLRAVILMAFANEFGYMLLNTSNKSEAAVGYGTLYGDMAGGLSVIGDLYKSEVYQLAREINSHAEIIPPAIISKPPSAELKPDQLDTDSLPPYSLLDPVLYRHIDLEWSADRIIADGFDKELVEEILRLVRTSEFKRKQTPPVLRVSSKAFGTGRRIPIIATRH